MVEVSSRKSRVAMLLSLHLQRTLEGIGRMRVILSADVSVRKRLSTTMNELKGFDGREGGLIYMHAAVGDRG